MPRLFTGLEIPRSLAERLMLLRGQVPGARWIALEDYHLTLRFLGDVSEAVAEEFAARIEPLEFPPFELELQGVGYFGRSWPTALWVGVTPSPALALLHRAHERAAVACGLEPDGRPFAPHVTIARLKRTKAAQIAPFLNDFAAFRAVPFAVRRALLYSSRPSRGGGPYAIEEAFPFIGEADTGDGEEE